MNNNNKNRENILDEYCEIYQKIIRLNDRIEKLKNETQKNVYSVSSEEQRVKIINDFKKQVAMIKTDKNLKKKYQNLMQRYRTLRNLLINQDNSPNNEKLIYNIHTDSLSQSHIDTDINIDSLEDNINELLEKYDIVNIPNLETSKKQSKLETNNLLGKSKFSGNYDDYELNKLKKSLEL